MLKPIPSLVPFECDVELEPDTPNIPPGIPPLKPPLFDVDEDTLDEKLFETPCECDTDEFVVWLTPVPVEVLELVP